MKKKPSSGRSELLLVNEELNLPAFAEGLQTIFRDGKSLQVEGTNVIRVPFGIRQPRRQRPERPERWATLVIPLQPLGSPTPPPQAA